MAWQHGVTDSLDLGVRVFNLGGELSAKVRLAHLEQPRLTLSLASTLGAES